MSDIDAGFSIVPSNDCPHISDPGFVVHADLNPDPRAAGKRPRQNRFLKYRTCEICGDGDEGWVCLACCFPGCSRYKQGHMVKHAQDGERANAHPVIAISLSDLSFWCFKCDTYITHPKLEGPFHEFHRGKFGHIPSRNLHTQDFSKIEVVLETDTNGGKSEGQIGPSFSSS